MKINVIVQKELATIDNAEMIVCDEYFDIILHYKFGWDKNGSLNGVMDTSKSTRWIMTAANGQKNFIKFMK